VILAAAASAAGCRGPSDIGAGDGPDPAARRWNLVVVAMTNVRADITGATGSDRGATPVLDELAARGIAFRNAWSPAPWTLPAAASFMTSAFPFTHGVMAAHDRLDEGWATLAETLREAGYTTAAFTGGGHYNRRFGLEQGFDLYLDEVTYPRFAIMPGVDSGSPRAGAAFLGLDTTAGPAIQWLARASEPFFLFAQGFDAHCPFSPRPPFDRFSRGLDAPAGSRDTCFWTAGPTESIDLPGGRFLPARAGLGDRDVLLSPTDLAALFNAYLGEVAQADAALGRLLEALEVAGVSSRTVLLVMSEHGDMIGDHGRIMRSGPHVGTFYEAVIRVPVVLALPGGDLPRTIVEPIQLVDLLPSLLELLQVGDPQRGRREGRSLVPLIRGAASFHDSVAVAGSRCVSNVHPWEGESWSVAARDRTWKLIHDELRSPSDGSCLWEQTRLFHLGDDPSESRDLSQRHPEEVARLTAGLTARFGDIASFWRCRPPSPDAITHR